MLSGGETFKHYKIIYPLDKGGMGEVFLAEDTILERKVAIKFLPENMNQDLHTRMRFLREAKAAAALDHPNICQVYETGEAEGRSFIAMEYLPGETLKSRLARGVLPLLETMQLACEIAGALAEAHEKSIVHRDLKPANIMIKSPGHPKIMDFGLAKHIEPATSASIEEAKKAQKVSSPSKEVPQEALETAETLDAFSAETIAGATLVPAAELTQTGTLLGTIDYMSPEQARCEPADARSDIFSFGVVLHEMLSGKNPFHRDSSVRTLTAILKEPEPQAQSSTGAGAVPASLRAILRKALAKDPSERYQNAREMEHELLAVRDDLMPRKRPAWVTWTLGAAGFAVVALVATSWWFASRSPAPAERPALPVLIADFENLTGENVFDSVLEQALEVGLEGASFITSYQRAGARKIAQTIQAGAKRLDRGLARLVAQREGIPVVLAGSIEKSNSGYRVSVEALDSVSGKATTKRQARANSKDDVLGEMAKLAVQIRKGLGDTKAQSTQLIAQETFTSSSLEAARSYAVGQELLAVSGKWREALEAYARAIQLDPEFGRAYAGMAVCYRNLVQNEEAQKYFQEAMKRIDRMTDREKYRTRGGYYILMQNYPRAIEQYEALIKQYPADGVGLSNLALAYFYARDMKGALEQGKKSVEMQPSSLPKRANLALYAMYAGDFDTAGPEAVKVMNMNPGYVTAYVCQAVSEMSKARIAQAEEIYRKLAEVDADGASLASMGLADLDFYQGKLAEGVAVLEKGIAADVAAKNISASAVKLTALAGAQLQLGHKSQAIAAVQRALRAGKEDRVLFESACLYLDAGRSADALALAKTLEARLEPEPQIYHHIIEARDLLSKGNRADALRLLESTLKPLDTWLSRFELGRTYLEAGAYSEAASEFEHCLKRRGEASALFLDDVPTMRYLPSVYYYMGRAQEGLGSPAAKESYRSFISLKEKGGEDPLLPDARRHAGL